MHASRGGRFRRLWLPGPVLARHPGKSMAESADLYWTSKDPVFRFRESGQLLPQFEALKKIAWDRERLCGALRLDAFVKNVST